MVCGCMGKSLVCIGYVSHLLYVGLVYRVGYLTGFKGFIGKVVYPHSVSPLGRTSLDSTWDLS